MTLVRRSPGPSKRADGPGAPVIAVHVYDYSQVLVLRALIW